MQSRAPRSTAQGDPDPLAEPALNDGQPMNESTGQIESVLPTDEIVEELRQAFDAMSAQDSRGLRNAKVRGMINVFARILDTVLGVASIGQAEARLAEVDEALGELRASDRPVDEPITRISALLDLAFQNARTSKETAKIADHLITRLVEELPSKS